MVYPRLHRDESDTPAPPVYQMTDFAGRDADSKHDAERAIERVQACLDRLDELIDPMPIEDYRASDDGPYAA